MVLPTNENKNYKLLGDIWSEFEGVFHQQFFSQFLQWQLNDMIRGKKTITIASIELTLLNEILDINVIDKFVKIIMSQVRSNDFVFSSDQEGKFYVLLTYSGIREVQFFINRLEEKLNNNILQESDNYCVIKGLLEISDGRFSVERILNEINYVHSIATESHQYMEQKVLRNTEFITPLKVSIIDSNELTHTILQNLLLGLNLPQTTYEISHFYSGESYLKSESYRSSSLQLILLSDILPERDGIEVLQQLRSQPNESKYFVIFLGSRNTEEETIYTMEQGADDYIAKPFNIKLLEVKIKRLLKRGI